MKRARVPNDLAAAAVATAIVAETGATAIEVGDRRLDRSRGCSDGASDRIDPGRLEKGIGRASPLMQSESPRRSGAIPNAFLVGAFACGDGVVARSPQTSAHRIVDLPSAGPIASSGGLLCNGADRAGSSHRWPWEEAPRRVAPVRSLPFGSTIRRSTPRPGRGLGESSPVVCRRPEPGRGGLHRRRPRCGRLRRPISRHSTRVGRAIC